jgi:hypothetical protein
MKSHKFFFTILILTLMACENDSIKDFHALTTFKGDGGLTYMQSLAKWNELKRSHGNSYIYQVTFQSWAGFSSVTELKVMDGVVVSRAYQEYIINGTSSDPEMIYSYNEPAVDVGKDEKGAMPMTIDEIYDTCAGKYLRVDKNDNTIYFDTDGNGIIKLCGFTPKGCADDCSRGVSIGSFTWLP